MLAITSSADVYKIKLKTGEIIWSRNTADSLYADATDFFVSSEIVIDNDKIFFSSGSNMFSLDTDTGKTNWIQEINSASTPIISGENIFIVKENVLITPDLDASLDGITRRTILELAKELNINCEIRKLKTEEVLEADEAFFSGTAAEVVPINSLDNKQIGAGGRGPITEQLQSTYFDQVRGAREANSNWHSLVE